MRQKNEFVIVFIWKLFYLREMKMDSKLTRYSVWLCTVAVQLSWNCVFLYAFPRQFTRKIYLCDIWKMLSQTEAIFFYSLKVGTGHQALSHFMHVIVDLLANFVSMEHHQGCNFSRSCQITFLQLSLVFGQMHVWLHGEGSQLPHQRLEVVKQRCKLWFTLIEIGDVFMYSSLLMFLPMPAFCSHCYNG